MSFEDDDTDPAVLEAHERRITRCRSCHAMIIWFKTPGGNMPVDASTVEPADDALDLQRHMSHFRTCPQAGQWRKPR